MRTPASRVSSNPKKGPSCSPRKSNTDSTRRVEFTDTCISIFGWPSRQGGVIILNDATHVDFTFLGLSTTNPPSKRPSYSPGPTIGANVVADGTEVASQPAEEERKEQQQEQQDSEDDEEDTLCQRLLLLGAKWWDGEKRYQFVEHFAAGIQPFVEDVEEGRVAEPTLRERRWVKVGWENNNVTVDGGGSGGSGGFWILDCDTSWLGIIEEDNLVPDDAARVKLAKTMEERCEILKGLGATFYDGLEHYNSESTFLRAWDWKLEGGSRGI
ncbi:MAG: hypothetical protein Q9212_001612 [Teloschistes hypoglaucus]